MLCANVITLRVLLKLHCNSRPLTRLYVLQAYTKSSSPLWAELETLTRGWERV